MLTDAATFLFQSSTLHNMQQSLIFYLNMWAIGFIAPNAPAKTNGST